jgi:hypothetical protein
VSRSDHCQRLPLRCWDNAVRAMLLPEGHRLLERLDWRVRVSCGRDALRPCLLPEGHGVRQPFHLNMCDSGRRVHPGAGGVRQLVLFRRRGLSQWSVRGMRRSRRGVHEGQRLLYRGRRVHQRHLPTRNVRCDKRAVHLGHRLLSDVCADLRRSEQGLHLPRARQHVYHHGPVLR